MIVPGDKIHYFKLAEGARQSLLNTQVRWGHAGLSEVTFMRTYSRRKSDGRMETWGDCVVRVIEGQFSILKTHAKQNRIPWKEERGQRLALEAAQRMHAFKWLPPGRGLWMMGTEYVWERGGAALNNCAFISTAQFADDDPEATIEPFRFLMDVAMLGVGPGFDTRGAGKILVRGATDSAPMVFEVSDDREGWVEAVALTLRAHIFGEPRVALDTTLVRDEGQLLKGFGGVASGPLPLIQGCHGIADILERMKGKLLDSVTITDLMNVIGKIVVAGNVRRTAEIAFAEPEDAAFRDMKNFAANATETGCSPPPELLEANPEDYAAYQRGGKEAARIARQYAKETWAYKFGGWRWASNNSIFAKVGMDYDQYNDSIATAGEPGFAWLELMRSHGRMKDPPNNADYRVMGGNPCLEQSLESHELCCLVENFPSHADDYWDFQRSLKFSYLYAKSVTLLGTHMERTNEVMIRNRRIGCSMSGIEDAIAKIGRTEFYQGWCDRGYNYVTYLDRKYSDWLGVRESIKKTSMKPSGTVSLLAGIAGPGGHLPKPTGWRTMRIVTRSPLVQALINANYKVEPSVTDPSGTMVVYFPWIVPEGVPTDSDCGLWEQVRTAADLQHWWADNQVSYTATFTAEEAARGEIGRVLTAHDGQLKGISLLPKAEGTYAQMPFMRADRAEVMEYAAQLLTIDFSSLNAHEVDDNFCDGAACEIRAPSEATLAAIVAIPEMVAAK